MKRKYILLIFMLFIGVFLLTACGSEKIKFYDSSSGGDVSTIRMNCGETAEVRVQYEGIGISDKSAVFTTENEDIVSITSFNYEDVSIKAINEGTTYLCAKTKHSKISKCQIIVTSIPVTEVSVFSEFDRICQDEEMKMTYSVYPSNATYRDCVWSCSNGDVATISPTGLLHAKTIGSVTVTATSREGVIGTRNISIVSEILPTSIYMLTSKQLGGYSTHSALLCEIYPRNCSDKTITWQSSDSNIVEVTEDGTLKTKGAGVASITATSVNGLSITCEITVPKTYPTLLTVCYGNKRMKSDSSTNFITTNAGEQIQFSYELSPSGVTEKNIVWEVSNDCGVITSDGNFTAIKLGSLVLKATTKNNLTVEINIYIF